MKKIAIALHDVRVSQGDKTISLITTMLQRFNAPLTVHLVYDTYLDKHSRLYIFLQSHLYKKNIEIVFHGTSHQCPEGTGRFFAFYHKYEAEFLFNSNQLLTKTTKQFRELENLFLITPAICPPCWIASRKNKKMFKTLSPLYIEYLFFLTNSYKTVFSPVISLGGVKKIELFLLKLLGSIMTLIAKMQKKSRTRLVVHVKDFAHEESLHYFDQKVRSLQKKGFITVLQHELFH
jgi:hypothetical protein